jgi:hypothetical protein
MSTDKTDTKQATIDCLQEVADLQFNRIEELEQALWMVRGATIACESDLQKVLYDRSSRALLGNEGPPSVKDH